MLFYPQTTWAKTNEHQNSIWPETSYCDLLQLTCELTCRSLQFLMESLNLNLSHSLFGLYKIIISSVAEKIGYIIELPSHTRSEWQSWVLNPTQHPLGREKRWGGWESVLTKSQDLGLQSGPTLLLIQLPVTLLCCFRKLGHRRAFCGSVCCPSGDHSCATYAFPDLFTFFYW